MSSERKPGHSIGSSRARKFNHATQESFVRSLPFRYYDTVAIIDPRTRVSFLKSPSYRWRWIISHLTPQGARAREPREKERGEKGQPDICASFGMHREWIVAPLAIRARLRDCSVIFSFS